MNEIQKFENYISNNIGNFEDIKQFLIKINKKHSDILDKNPNYNNKEFDDFRDSIKTIMKFESKCCEDEDHTDCLCEIRACKHNNIIECACCGSTYCFYCAENSNYFIACESFCGKYICDECKKSPTGHDNKYRKLNATEYNRYVDPEDDYDSDDSNCVDYYLCDDCKIDES